MSTNDTYLNGVLRERADDTTRTVTTYDDAGQVTSSRPYTDEENAAADAAEQARAADAAARARAELADAILDATAALMEDAHTDGAAWVQPQVAHDAYPLGATVTHKGKTWTSTIAANVWKPGVYGWA